MTELSCKDNKKCLEAGGKGCGPRCKKYTWDWERIPERTEGLTKFRIKLMTAIVSRGAGDEVAAYCGMSLHKLRMLISGALPSKDDIIGLALGLKVSADYFK